MRLVFSSAVAMAAVLALIYADVGQAVDTFVTLATYHDYDLAKHGWKLTPELVCSKWHSGESIEWGAKYGWVAFCLPDLQPIGPDFCGQCVQVSVLLIVTGHVGQIFGRSKCLTMNSSRGSELVYITSMMVVYNMQIQSQETGHTITARIVDQCTRPESGLVLDYKTVFEPLDDKTGRGKRFGSIFVTYQFVSCN
ncbi:unnamed protein product [Linum perenne]